MITPLGLAVISRELCSRLGVSRRPVDDEAPHARAAKFAVQLQPYEAESRVGIRGALRLADYLALIVEGQTSLEYRRNS